MTPKKWGIRLLTLIILFSFATNSLLAYAKEFKTIVKEAIPQKTQWEEEYPYVHEQAFGNDTYLKGIYDDSIHYFNTGNWKINKATLYLEFATTQMLNSEISYFTIQLNGEPVRTMEMPNTEGKTQVLEISLPIERILKSQVNSITINAYIRGEITDACVDDASTSAWMNIFADSKILLGYEPLQEYDTIDRFYQKFTAIETLDYEQSVICVPESPSEEELTGMAYILAGISKNADLYYQNINTKMIASYEQLTKKPFVIYLCTYDKLFPQVRRLLSEAQREYAQNSGLMALVQEEDTNILLITSQDPAVIENAGNMFGNRDYMQQLSRVDKVLSPTDRYEEDHYKLEPYISLTDTGKEVRGNFKQSAIFHIEYPANRTIAQSSQFSLDYRYSQNLDFEKSLVTVYINDVPIGSRALSKERADGANDVFDIPQDLNITGSFQVEVVFDLQVGDKWCDLSPDEVPWGYIAETSMLKINSVDKSDIYFENLPSPFVKDGLLNEVCIILPESTKNVDIESLGDVMLTMGRYLKSNRGNLDVVFHTNKISLADKNVISIGIALKNRVILENPDSLTFRYNAQGELISASKIRIDREYGQLAGTIQLLPSRYSETICAMLIISGSSYDGLNHASSQLEDANYLWELKGDAAITDGEDTKCYYLGGAIQNPVAPMTPPETKEQAKSFVIIVISIAGLTFLALIMILLKYRRKDDDEK